MASQSHYPSTWPALSTQLRPYQGPFPTTPPPSIKFPPNRPSVPHSATIKVFGPQSHGRTGQDRICCKSVACGEALAIGEAPTRGGTASQERRKGRRVADCRETGNPGLRRRWQPSIPPDAAPKAKGRPPSPPPRSLPSSSASD